MGIIHRSSRVLISLSRKTKSSPSVGFEGASNYSNARTHSIPPRNHKPFSTRLPVELAGGESLMPLHTATASSLLRSMLSSKVGQWCSLSEGFATPL